MTVASALALTAAAACGLDVVGIDPAPTEEPVVDAGAVVDTRADAGGARCPSMAAIPPDAGARTAAALRSQTAKTIDGDLSDWRGCPSFVLDQTTGAYASPTKPEASARVSLEWAPDALYVAATIADATLAGDSLSIFRNDSFEIYVSGNPARGGDYELGLDHHYIIDHRGMGLDYSFDPAAGGTPWSGGVVVPVPGGYQVEAKIPASDLGGPLAPGRPLWFDAMLSDVVGPNGETAYVIWAMTPHESCPKCDPPCACQSTPAFDTLQFAPITLE